MKSAFSIFLVAAAASLFAGAGNAQNSLTADSLRGRWCTDVAAYTFAADKLVVTFFNGKPQTVWPIQKINVGDGWIEVRWDNKEHGNTVFQDFSSNTMKQNANVGGDKGPDRLFHRC